MANQSLGLGTEANDGTGDGRGYRRTARHYD